MAFLFSCENSKWSQKLNTKTVSLRNVKIRFIDENE